MTPTFSHANILRLSNRPFRSIEEHDETLIANWNSVVSPEDTVWHLGDVNLGKFDESIELVRRLNGHKHLVSGNHDRLFVDPDAKRPDKNARVADRFRPIYKDIFEKVFEGDQYAAAQAVVELSNSQLVRVSHFPYGTADSHGEPRFAGIRPVDDGTVLLHGHIHASEKVSVSALNTMQIHVGVDSWNYFPVPEDAILDLLWQ